ncbi:hypothetical protein [Mycobacterium sp. 852002-30065_SCH5024008]|uniref:hypothetical protein n=1 Tax=Mycobacterium sp. 852002-30065_SCH5024008 TaxID=1834088 RepID=UPI0007FED3E2|nr:hypothetical protein [Mycobacterium sp. 852002-30065_SCH5024008]OBB90172.1 hypothetical protein A5781_23880 [Mycobacterium sp. 852002-30065_SCH5024008]
MLQRLQADRLRLNRLRVNRLRVDRLRRVAGETLDRPVAAATARRGLAALLTATLLGRHRHRNGHGHYHRRDVDGHIGRGRRGARIGRGLSLIHI